VAQKDETIEQLRRALVHQDGTMKRLFHKLGQLGNTMFQKDKEHAERVKEIIEFKTKLENTILVETVDLKAEIEEGDAEEESIQSLVTSPLVHVKTEAIERAAEAERKTKYLLQPP
jgi:tRNA(Phe) wybutosine-synthesizing methylase Tyw3